MDSDQSFYKDDYDAFSEDSFQHSLERNQDHLSNELKVELSEESDPHDHSSILDSSISSQLSEKAVQGEQLQLLKNIAKEASKERITSPYLSKYEKAFVLGKRAAMIAKNSPIYIHLEVRKDELNPLLIAQRELENNCLPFVLRRMLPNGEYEDWKLTQLNK